MNGCRVARISAVRSALTAWSEDMTRALRTERARRPRRARRSAPDAARTKRPPARQTYSFREILERAARR